MYFQVNIYFIFQSKNLNACVRYGRQTRTTQNVVVWYSNNTIENIAYDNWRDKLCLIKTCSYAVHVQSRIKRKCTALGIALSRPAPSRCVDSSARPRIFPYPNREQMEKYYQQHRSFSVFSFFFCFLTSKRRQHILFAMKTSYCRKNETFGVRILKTVLHTSKKPEIYKN